MNTVETATEIKSFSVEVPYEQLDDLRRRIGAARLPSKELVDDRSQGVQLALIRELAHYWATDYDWRKAEVKLNALPQCTTEIDGVDVHFIHVRSQHEDALPTGNWVWSFVPDEHEGKTHLISRNRFRLRHWPRRSGCSRWSLRRSSWSTRWCAGSSDAPNSSPPIGRRRHVPESTRTFTADDARLIGEEIGIEWTTSPFDIEQLRIGMNVELEHGLHDPLTNVSDEDPHITAKIALAHLNEFPDYYTRLERMEEEAKRDWAERTGT
jgi:hypothetical protein